MKSQIKTIDALLAEKTIHPVEEISAQEIPGIEIENLGFKNVQYKEHIQRPISKIINLSTVIYD